MGRRDHAVDIRVLYVYIVQVKIKLFFFGTDFILDRSAP